MIIARSAKARHLSTAALYKGTIESKNRQMHWTIRYSYCATPVTDLDTHRANQAHHQSLSNLVGESTTAGDLPTKEGVSGTLAFGRRRRLAPVRSAELLSCCCCSALSGGLLALLACLAQAAGALHPGTNYSSDEWMDLLPYPAWPLRLA